jgi:hypothetical protein
VLAVRLRHPGRAAQLPEGADSCYDRLLDLPGAGFIGALQRRREQRLGSGSTDAEVIGRGSHFDLLG